MRKQFAKYISVRDKLEAEIRTGRLVAGDQLPRESILAERYGVSFMTARRAVADLVSSEMLERRARIGTFVRSQSIEKLNKPVLNLVTYEYEGAWHRTFLSHGMHIAEREGWRTNIIRLTAGQQEPAVRVIRNGEMTIVFVQEVPSASALAHAMRSPNSRAVLIDYQLSEFGIPSIGYDLESTITLAVNHLRSAGHRDIALMVQSPEDANALKLIIGWKNLISEHYPPDEINKRLIRVHTPRFNSPCEPGYQAMTEFFARGECAPTGLICLGDELTLGVVGACHAAGRSVPDAMSIINIGDSPLLAVSIPPVTCVDANLAQQLEIAVSIIKKPRQELTRDDLIHVVEPKIIMRKSVSRVP